MLKRRIIPTLLMKGPGLVKGKRFDSWRPLGPVLPAVRVYESRQVDELILLDISASLENRGPDLSTIEDVAAECFMPLAVGGGIRSISDVRDLLNAGADKVVANTQAWLYPGLVSDIAEKFGSQCVVVSIDVRDNQVVVFSGTEPTGDDSIDWAREVDALGAGEIMLTSVDRDGMMDGYDLDLIRDVSNAVSIPVIASGGAGEYEHFVEAFEAGAHAVAASAMFQFTEATPLGAKQYLHKHHIPVRL